MVAAVSGGALLKAGRKAPFVTIEELAGPQNIMVLAPHPDDESLGCGAALAAAQALGRQVCVVALTDGAGSHPHSKSYPPARLAALRERELRQAVARLTRGRGEVRMLRYPDQQIPHSSAARSAIVKRLAGIVDECEIGTIWTTWEGDPHCDHQMAASLARQLVTARRHLALWRFLIWGRFARQRVGLTGRLVRFDGRPYRRVKTSAITAHRSQMTPFIADARSAFTMPWAMQRHFINSPEFFLKAYADG